MAEKEQKTKIRIKNKGNKIENSNEYGRYSSNYISNHFECQGLNVPIKKQRLSQWIKNKTHLYVVYKKPTLNIETYND